MADRNANSLVSNNLVPPVAVIAARHSASPKLYEACCKGTHLPEVVIELW